MANKTGRTGKRNAARNRLQAKISLRPVGDLIPYINNPRTHSDEQVAVIAGSIREFGWTNPVLIDGRNGIIAGHGRVLAARKLGLAQVPCIELVLLHHKFRRRLRGKRRAQHWHR
jgi:ParB-like chromosome segregation protein Spo0J